MTLDTLAKVMVRCSLCDRERAVKPKKDGEGKLPVGWHAKSPSEPVCETCWAARYIVRAVTIPVGHVVPAEGETVEAAWKAFRDACRQVWRASVRIANWAVTQLTAADGELWKWGGPGEGKMPSKPDIYLYGLGKPWDAWGVDAASASSLLRAAENAYVTDRLAVRLGKRAARSYTSMPYPVRADSVTLSVGENGEPYVHFRLGGRRWTVQLKRGPGWVKAVASHKLLCEEPWRAGEIKIIDKGRDPPAIALVGWLDKKPLGPRADKLLTLQTDKSAFWTAMLQGRDQPWVLNADHIQRQNAKHACKMAGMRHRRHPLWQGMLPPESLRAAIEEYDRRRQRLAEDGKKEKRRPAAAAKDMAALRESWASHHNDTLKTWCNQAVSMLVGWAKRNGVARIVYDDSEQGYMPRFPWSMLREKLEQSCSLHNIDFERRSAGEDAGPARGKRKP